MADVWLADCMKTLTLLIKFLTFWLLTDAACGDGDFMSSLRNFCVVQSLGSIDQQLKSLCDNLHARLSHLKIMQQACRLRPSSVPFCEPFCVRSRHEVRQRRPVLTCAGALRDTLHQRAQRAGMHAAALALSGLCLVGSKFRISKFVCKCSLASKLRLNLG